MNNEREKKNNKFETLAVLELSRERMETLYKEAGKNGGIRSAVMVYNYMNGLLSEKLYRGDWVFGRRNITCNMKYKERDMVIFARYRPESDNRQYKGGKECMLQTLIKRGTVRCGGIGIVRRRG